MQGQFWKNFPGARAPESRGAATAESRAHGADAGARPGRRGPDARLSPRGAPRGRAVLPPPSFPAPSGHLEFRRPPLFALGVRSAMRRAATPPATVPLLGPITLSPTRPFQNRAGLRG